MSVESPFSKPEHEAWRQGLASIRVSSPAQGDTASNFRLFLDADFGDVPIFIEGTEDTLGMQKAFAHVQIAACELRLDLDNCSDARWSPLFGDPEPDDPRRFVVETSSTKQAFESEMRAEVGFGLVGSLAGLGLEGNCAARAKAARRQEKETTRTTDRTLPVQAVEPCGLNKWLIFDRESTALSGRFIRSTEGEFCRLSASDGEATVTVSIVCEPQDLIPKFPQGSLWRRLVGKNRNLDALVTVALQQGLKVHSSQKNLLELARSTMQVTR